MSRALVTGKSVYSRLFAVNEKERLLRPSKHGQDILGKMPLFLQKIILNTPWWRVAGDLEEVGRFMYPSAHFIGLYDNLIFINGYARKFKWGKFSYFRYVSIFYFYLADLGLERDFLKVGEARIWIDSLDMFSLWSLDRYLRFILQADEISQTFELSKWGIEDFQRFYFPEKNLKFACLSVKLAMLYVFGCLKYSAAQESLFVYEAFGEYEAIEFVVEEGNGARIMLGFYEEELFFPGFKDDALHEFTFKAPSFARRHDNLLNGWQRSRDWDSGFRYLYECRDELHVRYRKILADYIESYLSAYLGGWFNFLRQISEILVPEGGYAERRCVENWRLSDLKFLFLLKEYVEELRVNLLHEFTSDIFVESEFGSDFTEVSLLRARSDWLLVTGFLGVFSEKLKSNSVGWFIKCFRKMFTRKFSNKFNFDFLEELFLCSMVFTTAELQGLFTKFNDQLVEAGPFREGISERSVMFDNGQLFDEIFSSFLAGTVLQDMPVKPDVFRRYKQSLLRKDFMDKVKMTYLGSILFFVKKYFPGVIEALSRNLVGNYSWSFVDLLVKLNSFRDGIFVQFINVYEWFFGQALMSTGDVSPYNNMANRKRSQYGPTTAFEEENYNEDWIHDEIFGFTERIDGDNLEVKEERKLYNSLTDDQRKEYMFFSEYDPASFDTSGKLVRKITFTSDVVLDVYDDFSEEEIFVHNFAYGRPGLFSEDKLWGFAWYFPPKEEFVLWNFTKTFVQADRNNVKEFFVALQWRIKQIVDKKFILYSIFINPYPRWKRVLTGRSNFDLSMIFETRVIFCMLLFPFLFFSEWRVCFEKWVEVQLPEKADIFLWGLVSLGFIFIFFPQFCVILLFFGIWFLWNYTRGIFRKLILYPWLYLFGLAKRCGGRKQGFNRFVVDPLGFSWLFKFLCFYLFLKFIVIPHSYECGVFVNNLVYGFVLYGLSPLFLLSWLSVVFFIIFLCFFWKSWGRVWYGLFGFLAVIAYVFNTAHFYETKSKWFSPYNQGQAWRLGAYFGEVRPSVLIPHPPRGQYWRRLPPTPREAFWLKEDSPYETLWDYRKPHNSSYTRKHTSMLKKWKELISMMNFRWQHVKVIGYPLPDATARTTLTTFYGDTVRQVSKTCPNVKEDKFFMAAYPSASLDVLYVPWYYPARCPVVGKLIPVAVENRFGLARYLPPPPPDFTFVPVDNKGWEVLTERQIYRGAVRVPTKWGEFLDTLYFGMPGKSVVKSWDPVLERGVGSANLFHSSYFAFFRGLFYEYPFVVFDVGLKSVRDYGENVPFIRWGYRSCIINLQDLKISLGVANKRQLIFDHYGYFIPHKNLDAEFDYTLDNWRYRWFYVISKEIYKLYPLEYYANFQHCSHVYMCYVF